MRYPTNNIDDLIKSCNEMHEYTLKYGALNKTESIYIKFCNALDYFENSHYFMRNNYAPRDILLWFVHHQHWTENDVKTIKTILVQIKNDHFYSEPVVEKPSEFWSLVHFKIDMICRRKFLDGYYADAVESAMKEVNSRVKKICIRQTGEEKDGTSLMQYVFSLNNPVLKFEDISIESGRNIQLGYMQLFAGAIQGIRNPKAHENLFISKERAMKQLILASLLMDKIDEALEYTGISEY